MTTPTKRPVIYITDDFETWKNKINGMVDYVDDNIESLLEDCVEDLVSKTMDERSIAMGIVFSDSGFQNKLYEY